MRLTEQDIHQIISRTVKRVLNEMGEGGFQGKSIILYHGSPHKFGKFSLGKLNTGQHSQDFGKGLYFTTDKESARFYADELSNTMTLMDKFKATVHSFQDPDGTFTRYLENDYRLLVKKYVENYIRNGIGRREEWEDFLKLMGETRRYAYLYTVEVTNPKFIDRSEYVAIQKGKGLNDNEMNRLLLSQGYNGIIYDMNTRKLSPRDFTGEKNVVIIDDSIINIVNCERVEFDYIMKLKI